METSAVLTVVSLLLLLMAIGAPVAFALGLSGATGLVLLLGTTSTTDTLGTLPYSVTAKYSWLVVPLFIFMGVMATRGRIGEDLFSLLSRILRRVPGSLGVATVGACAGFAAICGSSLATASTVGRIAVSQMRDRGYPIHLAAGIVAYSGTLGVLIPPSIIIVVYALISGEPVGDMLLAGIIPGILSAVAFGSYVMLRGLRLQASSPPAVDQTVQTAGSSRGVGTVGVATQVRSRQQTVEQVRAALLVGLIFALVVGGVYGGAFTVTEAAAFGAVACLVAVPIHLRHHSSGRGDGQAKTMWLAARESANTTAMVFAIVVGASIFTTFLVLARVPSSVAVWIASLDVPPLVVLVIVLLSTIPLGMFLDAYSMVLIVVPIAYPAVTEAGYSGVLFGILMVKMIEIAFVTPPLGLNCYVVASSVKGVQVESVFRGVVPFIFVDLAIVALLIAFPEITLWLPGLASKT